MGTLASLTSSSPAHDAGIGRPERSSLEHYLAPMASLLADHDVTEICINRPGEAWVERYSGWRREALPFCSFDWCIALAHLVANFTKQRVSANEPVLSATLPTGERTQFVLPPVASDGTVSITIRKPSAVLWTLDQLASRAPIDSRLPDGRTIALTLDVFSETRFGPARPSSGVARDVSMPAQQTLTECIVNNDALRFLKTAVACRKNILLSGATGSGKTTIAKALILEVPADDRIVTIEDVRELVLANQPNSVSLLYSQGGQGQARVTGNELLVSAKRMRPDRVFVSELRTGDEAYDYLVSVNSGHPGSITSVHADSAEGAFVALAQLLKRSEAGRGMSTREGVELAKQHVDVVVQCARVRQRRFVSEIWYDPSTQHGHAA